MPTRLPLSSFSQLLWWRLVGRRIVEWSVSSGTDVAWERGVDTEQLDTLNCNQTNDR